MHPLKDLQAKFLLRWKTRFPSRQQRSEIAAQAVKPARVARRKQDMTARGAVSQALWGQGNLNPGASEFVSELTAKLGLNEEMSMLDLGAGFGGPARAISTAFGIWMTAHEAVPEHVKIGMEQSVMHGMGKKVPITHFDPETVFLPKDKFDCVFSKELFHLVNHKVRLLAKIEDTLKPLGQFFIIDYLVTEKGKRSQSIAAWNNADEQTSMFWSKEDYISAFNTTKLDLRVTEDLTPQYVRMISEGFQQLNIEKLLAGEDHAVQLPELRRALAFESNRWAVRAAAMHAGDIVLTRLSGLNRKEHEIR